MNNPWNEVDLAAYESHMRLDTVGQLHALHEMMEDQLGRYGYDTAMILGIAGGNGLDCLPAGRMRRVYGVDVNEAYLAACAERYGELKDIFRPIAADLTEEGLTLPHAALLIADLLLEYIGYEAFARVVTTVRPLCVSCVIQINTGEDFVSDSPYLHVFDRLEEVHHQMEEDELHAVMAGLGFAEMFSREWDLPNGKKLLRLDYRRVK